MRKVVRIGTVLELRHSYNEPKQPTDVFCKVTLENGKLSIVGVVGPRNNGDCWGGAGQIVGSIEAKAVTPAPGWDNAKISRFFEVWEAWHLNDMRANCQHQTGEAWDTTKKVELVTYKLNSETIVKQSNTERKAADRLERGEIVQYTPAELTLVRLPYEIKQPAEKKAPQVAHYKEEKRETKAVGWLSEKEHPRGLLSKPCPVCGYKYGTEWKREEIPAEVVAFLESLPDTDKTTAWV